MVTSLYEEVVENKHPASATVDPLQLELQRARPKVHRINVSGVFIYILGPDPSDTSLGDSQTSTSSSGDSIQSFYAHFHVASKNASVAGVNDDV
jgi:hypothetical protein